MRSRCLSTNPTFPSNAITSLESTTWYTIVFIDQEEYKTGADEKDASSKTLGQIITQKQDNGQS